MPPDYEAIEPYASHFGRDVTAVGKDLESFAALLRKWQSIQNLVSRETLSSVWTRHFADSVQLMKYFEPSDRLVLDFGSGGGFPGMVCAILAAELSPRTKFTFVESDKRKCTFLQTVAREAGIGARVVSERIEELEPQNADLVTARALAPLPALLGFAERHLQAGGRALFLKGESYAQEIQAALETRRFTYQEYTSKTDENAVILMIEEIERG